MPPSARRWKAMGAEGGVPPGAGNGERSILLSLLSESKALAMATAAHLVQAGCGVADTLERLATPGLVPLPLPLAASGW